MMKGSTRRSRDTMRALVVSLVPIGALVALGGAYSWSTLPLLAAAAFAFLVSGARVATDRETRVLDVALVALLAGMTLQLVPLSSTVVTLVSPHAASMQAMLALQAAGDARPITIDERLTRGALASATAAMLLFWAARETFSRGGVRVAARAIAWTGFAAALVGLAQRATAPTLLLWTWTPLDRGAQPFGPFVNRNHFASWLLLASSLTAGYLIAHIRSHRLEQHSSRRLILRDLLEDGSALFLSAAVAAMLFALVGSLSRAALLGAFAALALGAWVGGRRQQLDRRPVKFAAATVVALLALAVWANREGLLGRLESMAGDNQVGRPAIWSETMPVVRDFWLTGTGAGTYGRAMLRYQRTRPDMLFNQAHNEYLQLLAEGGLLLALPATLALAAWLRLARRRVGQDPHELLWIRIGALAGCFGLAVQSFFETGLRMPANALLFALLAAIVVHPPRVRIRSSEGGSE
jgi:O-antigen ligase